MRSWSWYVFNIVIASYCLPYLLFILLASSRHFEFPRGGSFGVWTDKARIWCSRKRFLIIHASRFRLYFEWWHCHPRPTPNHISMDVGVSQRSHIIGPHQNCSNPGCRPPWYFVGWGRWECNAGILNGSRGFRLDLQPSKRRRAMVRCCQQFLFGCMPKYCREPPAYLPYAQTWRTPHQFRPASFPLVWTGHETRR